MLLFIFLLTLPRFIDSYSTTRKEVYFFFLLFGLRPCSRFIYEKLARCQLSSGPQRETLLATEHYSLLSTSLHKTEYIMLCRMTAIVLLKCWQNIHQNKWRTNLKALAPFCLRYQKRKVRGSGLSFDRTHQTFIYEL